MRRLKRLSDHTRPARRVPARSIVPDSERLSRFGGSLIRGEREHLNGGENFPGHGLPLLPLKKLGSQPGSQPGIAAHGFELLDAAGSLVPLRKVAR